MRRHAFKAPVARPAAAPGAAVAGALAVADEVRDDEELRWDAKDKRDKNHELHSKVLKFRSSNMTLPILLYLASTADVFSKLAAADCCKIDGTWGLLFRMQQKPWIFVASPRGKGVK